MPDHQGWRGIAAAIGKSPKTAREWAIKRGLPVRVLCGSVFMRQAELDAWRLLNAPLLVQVVKARELGAAAAAPQVAAA